MANKLGFITIFTLLISSLLGTGIFFAPAVALKYAGKASIISWIIMMLISIYIAMCFADLVSKFPSAGGVYEYSKKAYGRFPSFLIGWITWLVNTINTPLLIVAAIFLIFPNASILYLVILSILIIIILNFIAYQGLKDSAIVLMLFAIITFAVIFMFLFKASFFISKDMVLPIHISNFLSIFIAIFFISETFFGWENAAFLSEETKNPKKTIPKALISATIIMSLLSTVVAIVSTILINSKGLVNKTSSFTIILKDLFQDYRLFIVGIFIVFIGSATSNIISTPRLLLAMARDKLFIEQFSDIHKKKQTPYKAIFFQTVVAILIIFISLGNYEVLLELLIPLSLVMYFFVIISIPIIRIKYKNLTKNSYNAPFGTILPWIVGSLFLTFIFLWLYYVNNAVEVFIYALSFIGFAIPVYILLNLYYNPYFSLKINEFFYTINDLLEPVFFPKRIRTKILNLFSDYSGKTVVAFGSGFTGFILDLGKRIGVDGKLIVIDSTVKSLKRITKKTLKHGFYHIDVVHDPHIITNFNSPVKQADFILNFDVLSYIQDLDLVLKQMAKTLPELGKVLFVEYMDFFHVIPNPKYLRKRKALMEIFRRNGFAVKITKIKGFFWNYSVIYGVKTNKNVPFI